MRYSGKTYNRLTNTGMLFGITSAWLYERNLLHHILAFVLAALAVVFSVGTYFSHHFKGATDGK